MELTIAKLQRYAHVLEFVAMAWGGYLMVFLVICKAWDIHYHTNEWWLGARREFYILLLRAPYLGSFPLYMLLNDVNELLARLASASCAVTGIFLFSPLRNKIRSSSPQ